MVSHAADEVTVADVTIPQGGTAQVSIGLTNPDRVYTAGQMVLELNEGVTPVLDEKGNLTTAKGSRLAAGHSIGSALLDDGTMQFTIFSSSSEAIEESEGTLFTVDIEADESLAVGTVLEGRLTAIELTTTASEPVLFNPIFFSVTIGEPDDGRIKFDETAAVLPAYTAGEKGNVRMKRTIKAGQWSTIVLPFTLTKAKAEAAFGSDVQLAEFSGFEVEYADEDDVTPDAITVNFSQYTMTAKKGMTGGKPFLIKTSQDVESFEADDVTLAGSVTDVEKADEYDTPGKFTGTLVPTKIPADGLFINDNKFWYSTGLTSVKAFRCWLELGAVLDKETDFGSRLRLQIDGEQTAVEGLTTTGTRTAGSVYTLGGQLVGRGLSLSTLPKGVYIVNGKKTVVK